MQKQKVHYKSIVSYAQTLKRTSNDPLELAKHYNYEVTYIPDSKQVLTARCATHGGKKLIIINEEYDLNSRRVLCAHELGHIILHKEGSRFDGEKSEKEFEANLFAVAFLLSEEDLANLPIDVEDMSNYTLKTILWKLMNTST